MSILYLRFKTKTLHLFHVKFDYNFNLHLIRAIILLGAFVFWNKGLEKSQLSAVTLFNYFIPTVTLILCRIILKEPFQKNDWIYNALLIFCVLMLFDNNISNQIQIVYLLFSIILFSLSDVINKKIVTKNNIIDVTIYTFCVLIIITFPFSIPNWTSITLKSFYIILLLGISTFFTLIFLLSALEMIKLSSLALHRYSELPISMFLGVVFLDQIPDSKVIISAFIILLISFIKLTYDAK